MGRFWRAIGLAVVMTGCTFAQRYPIQSVAGSPKGILTMMQDRRSAIWLGTEDDVFCFDGKTFFSIRQYGFPRERVTSLAEDADGGIWIATQTRPSQGATTRGGIYRYRQGKVVKIFSGGFLSLVSAGPNTMLASEARDEKYGDVYVFRKSGGDWQATRVLVNAATTLSLDHTGSVLFPCPGGFCELTQQQILDWPRSSLRPRLTPLRMLDPGTRVWRDRFDCLWFRSEVSTDYQCPNQPLTPLPDMVGNDGSHYLSESSDESDGPDDSILMLGEASRIALGRPGRFKIAGASNGVPAGIQTALRARDGTIFLGASDGLYRWTYPFRLEFWNQDQGVDSPYFILRIGDQVFASNSGIRKLDPSRANWVPWASSNQVGTAVHMLPGSGQTMYVASLIRGATLLDEHGQVLAKSKFGLGGARLASDVYGQTWLAGPGITLLKRKGQELEMIPQGLPGGTVLDMEYDTRNKALWGCDEREVVVLDAGRWTHIAQKDGLLDDDCRSIAVLDNGDVWIAYRQIADLSRIRREPSGTIQIDSFPTDGKTHDGDNIFLDSDSRGWLWMASNRGDYAATPDAATHGNWLRLDGQDGIPSPGGNQNSFYGDKDGSIWFGSQNTVVHFTPPEAFATRFPMPEVFLSGIAVGSDKPILLDAVASIPHGKSITLQIGSLQFDRRNALRLRYRLLPGQPEWKETDSFDVPLGQLAGGDYTLELQGHLLSGAWSDVERSSFHVLVPFWLQWPGLLAIGFTVAGIGLGFTRWMRHRRLIRSLTLPNIDKVRGKALSPESADFIGTVLDGRYEIGEILFIGGLSTVVRARDLHKDGMLCAVKLFESERADQAWILHRFEQEVEALELLNHPHIVRMEGHGVTPLGAPYLVMEFIQGETLRKLLERGALPRTLVARFLNQLASALSALHSNGIFHRDIKPENLMIRVDEDDQEQIVLIDFSIAIVKSPEKTLQGISRVAGTLEYMAPEQVIGYAAAATDIYILAKVLVEMLTGSRWSELIPEATLDSAERIVAILKGRRYQLTEASLAMIAAALEFDPARRPENVLRFAEPIVSDLSAEA